MNYLTNLSYCDETTYFEKVHSTLQEFKVVKIKRIPDDNDVLTFYDHLTKKLGIQIRRGEDFKKNQFTKDQWLDVSYNPTKANTYRHSNTRQPFHTDGAYISEFNFDIVFLICTQQADHGGATTFLDADLLIEILHKNEPELLTELQSTEVHFVKDGFGSLNRKIIDKDDMGWLLNWNYYRVAKTNSQVVLKMVESFHQFLEKRIFESGIMTPIILQKGEAVFFHDRRVLHGRNAFFGERCLIKGALLI